jgi:integral membrane protein
MSLFATAAVAEAISWLALLTGMVVKYGPPQNEIGVKIFGPVHGALFMAYVLLVLVVARLGRWRWWTTVVALICAVPPFATLAFERWARRQRLLDPAEREPTPVSAR